MKLTNANEKVAKATIPFTLVERGTRPEFRDLHKAPQYPLDGIYEIEYPGTSTKGRVIEVKNHSWAAQDGSFIYHVDMPTTNSAKFSWQASGTRQWTSWSGRWVPEVLTWSTNNSSYPTIVWRLKGSRMHNMGRKMFRNAMCGPTGCPPSMSRASNPTTYDRAGDHAW